MSVLDGFANESYIIVSYFTSRTPYEKEAERFILNVGRLNLRADVEGIPSQGDWFANTAFKAKFVLKKLADYPDHDIVFIDIDAVIWKVPHLFENLGKEFDFGAHFRMRAKRPNELLSGTTFFANRPIVKALVLDWIKINETHPKRFEQTNLHVAMNHHRASSGLRVFNLPLEYCLIFDGEERRRGKRIDPTIEHYQVSRKYRVRIR